jgi:hypothetical protein
MEMKFRSESVMMAFVLLLICFSSEGVCDPPELMCRWPFRLTYPDWAYHYLLGACDGINHLSPDSEEQMRLVFGLRDSTVHILDYQCEELDGWPVKGEGVVNGAAAVGDINADRYEEVIIDFLDDSDTRHIRTGIHAYRLDGSDLPGFPLELDRRGGLLGKPCATPQVLCDFDKNGTLEIAFTMCSDSIACVLNCYGQFLPGWPKNIGPDNFWGNPVSVGDIDKDGYFDIVALSRNHLFVWNSEGLDLPGWPADLPDSLYPSFFSAPSLADLDGDGSLEILFSTYEWSQFLYGKLFVYHSDGSIMEGWPVNFADAIAVTTPTIGDLDNDGQLEIVVGLSERGPVDNMYVLNTDGSVQSSWHIEDWGNHSFDPVLVDVDNNGYADIVVSTNMNVCYPDTTCGAYYAYDKDGNLLDGWPVVVYDLTDIVAATFFDLDGDSSLNMAVSSSCNYNFYPPHVASFHAWLYDLHVPVNRDLMFWPKYGHDQYHTSNFHFKVPPVTQVEGAGATAPFGFRLYQNYPNPFNEETTIRFNLPRGQSGEVTLEVFDIHGRRVKRLSQVVERYLPGNGPAGYTFTWDGSDNGGQSVSSGIYFYRLRFGDRLLVRKMTLIR